MKLTDGDERQNFPTSSPKPDTKKITTVQKIPSAASLYNEVSQFKQISAYKINIEDTRMAKLDDFHGHFAELDQMVKSMMEKSQKVMPIVNGKRQTANVCKVCGKEGQKVAIRDHIEANHLEGVSLPCNLCEKTFRSRNTLRLHKISHHRI